MPHNDATTRREPATLLAQGDQLMKNQSFAEAITRYEEHLSSAPTDLAAHMKLGICHLLNRGDNRFLKIFHAVRRQMAIVPEQPPEVQTLWDKYQRLVVKVTAGALVIGGLSLAGCASQGNALESVTNPSPPVVTSGAELPEIAPLPQLQEDSPFTGHKYSGGIYFDTDHYPFVRPIIPDLPTPNEEKQVTDKDHDEDNHETMEDQQK